MPLNRDIVDAYTTVLERFRDVFVASHPTIPVAHDNLDFIPEEHAPEGTWVYLVFLPAESRRASISTLRKRWRHTGKALIQCHTPIGDKESGGAQPGLELARDVTAAFRGITISGVRFKAPRILRGGPQETSYRVDVEARWEFDSLETP